MITYLSLVVSIIGALFYGVSKNPKLEELGRLAFGAGLLAFLLAYTKVISILR